MDEEIDARRLIIFEKELGLYSAAGAICSYGDVIDFVEGEKQGVVIADTCGHLESCGQKMAQFLRQEIKTGWGIEGDAEQNLEKLGQKLFDLRGGKNRPYSDEWYDWVSASYTQFSKEKISLAMGGGLGETLILREDCSLESIRMRGGVIDEDYLEGHDPVYETTLQETEVMLLQSDGLLGNIYKNYWKHKLKDKNEFELKEVIGYNKGHLVSILAENRDCSPSVIRDALVSRLSQYFGPLFIRDDDVTFVVVKINR
ncbi:MAG: hypothetical protein AABW48_06060 [Nanoarchaeota archaeon]